MTTLEVSSLTKWYGPVRGVEGVTFSVEPGEIFGYLGPNGAGKTTTIRCIMGLLSATCGSVRVLGQSVVAGRATQHDRIGYLPGDFRLWPLPRAKRSLGLLAALGRTGSADVRREELAQRLGLDLQRRVGGLSKGNRQKVGVMYAFQHQPDLLILDEPTSGLDPLVREVVLDLIREAAASGATVLLSSHDLSEVAAVCHRAAILREGRLVRLAPISELIHSGQRRLKVWFADHRLMPKVPAESLPMVRVVEQEPGVLHLAYQGPVDAVLKWLSQFVVDRMSTPQTSLQDAFIQYYQGATDADLAPVSGGRV